MARGRGIALERHGDRVLRGLAGGEQRQLGGFEHAGRRRDLGVGLRLAAPAPGEPEQLPADHGARRADGDRGEAAHPPVGEQAGRSPSAEGDPGHP